MDRAGGAQQVARPGQRLRSQVARDIDHRDPGPGDALLAEQDEVGVAVAVGVDRLDVDDPPGGRRTTRRRRRAADRLEPWRALARALRRAAWVALGRLAVPAAAEGEGGGRGKGGETGESRQAASIFVILSFFFGPRGTSTVTT